MRAITSSRISFGQTASHSPMLVQLPKTLRVHLRHHAQRAPMPLRLALRQQAEVRDLRAGEQRGRRVRARRHAGAAADAGGRVHRAVRVFLRHRDGVAVRRAAGGDARCSRRPR